MQRFTFVIIHPLILISMSCDSRNTMKKKIKISKYDFCRQILLRELHSCESSRSRKQSFNEISKMFLMQYLCIYLYNFLEMLESREALFRMTLKAVSATFLLVCFLNQKESACETRKNVFYFTSKAFFVLEKTKV